MVSDRGIRRAAIEEGHLQHRVQGYERPPCPDIPPACKAIVTTHQPEVNTGFHRFQRLPVRRGARALTYTDRIRNFCYWRNSDESRGCELSSDNTPRAESRKCQPNAGINRKRTSSWGSWNDGITPKQSTASKTDLDYIPMARSLGLSLNFKQMAGQGSRREDGNRQAPSIPDHEQQPLSLADMPDVHNTPKRKTIHATQDRQPNRFQRKNGANGLPKRFLTPL